jgi:hypothetical protein
MAMPARASSRAVRSAGGNGVGTGESELALGLVKMAQQQEAPHFEMKGMGGVHTISARLQRRTRGSQILFRPP